MSLKKLQINRFVFFAIPLFSGIAYLLAFYPGIMSYDSIFQWDQVARFDFNNWHPAYHTIILWLLTRIWYSPAMIAWFQILIFSLVIAYGLAFFQDLGVSTPLLYLVCLLISIIPLNGVMVVTLWKDVLYSISVLLLCIYLLKIIFSKGNWLTARLNFLWLGLVTANITLLRQNGFPVAFGTLFLLPLVFHRWRPVLRLWVYPCCGL